MVEFENNNGSWIWDQNVKWIRFSKVCNLFLKPIVNNCLDIAFFCPSGGDWGGLVNRSNYELWNEALVDYFLKPGKTIFLSCDSSVLGEIAKKSRLIECLDNPVEDFKKAIMTQIEPKLKSNPMDSVAGALSYVGLMAFHVYCFYESEDRGEGTGGFWDTYAREIGLPGEGNLKPGHREWVRGVWLGFKEWVDGEKDLKYGRMNDFERVRFSYHLVNIIKSHTALRAKELKLLPKLFYERGLLPNHLASRKRLSMDMDNFVASISSRAKSISENEELKSYGELQVLNFYDAWDGSAPDKQMNDPGREQRLWCQIRHEPERHLAGGLVKVSEPLVSIEGKGKMLNYLEKVDERGLLTTYNSITGRFEESRSFAEGDWVLFFFKAGNYGEWRDGLESFVEEETFLRGETYPGAKVVDDLPANLGALLFRVVDHPDDVPDKWAAFYSPKHNGIRLEGGLRLEKARVWLAGAEPRILCEAGVPNIEVASPQDHDGDRVWPSAGGYQLTNAFSTVRLDIRDSNRCLEAAPEKWWVFEEHTWPKFDEVELDAHSTSLQGARYQKGAEDDAQEIGPLFEQDLTVERSWTEMNLKLRGLPSETRRREPLICKVLDMDMERFNG